MQRIVECVLRMPSEAVSGRITSTTSPSESLQEQGALTDGRCVRGCTSGSVMKFTYATEPPAHPQWVREVLVDLLNLSIIQHNVDLIMHSEASLEIT